MHLFRPQKVLKDLSGVPGILLGNSSAGTRLKGDADSDALYFQAALRVSHHNPPGCIQTVKYHLLLNPGGR